MNREFVDMEEL